MVEDNLCSGVSVETQDCTNSVLEEGLFEIDTLLCNFFELYLIKIFLSIRSSSFTMIIICIDHLGFICLLFGRKLDIKVKFICIIQSLPSCGLAT